MVRRSSRSSSKASVREEELLAHLNAIVDIAIRQIPIYGFAMKILIWLSLRPTYSVKLESFLAH